MQLSQQEKESANFTKNSLNIFADAVELYSYSMEDGSAYSPKTEDIFLITTVSFDKHNEVLKYIPKDKPIINGNITFKNSVLKN